MFMCLWDNSHFLCIKQTQTLRNVLKEAWYIDVDGDNEDEGVVPAMKMAVMLWTLIRLREVIKTKTSVLMVIRVGRLCVSAGL